MNNFDKQLKAAIETYSKISGMTFSEVAEKCMEMEGPIYRSVTMMMVAAR